MAAIGEDGKVAESGDVPSSVPAPFDDSDRVASAPNATAIGRDVFAFMCGEQICLATVGARVAIPERGAEVRRTTLGNASAHKIKVRLRQPLETGSACWIGRLLFRSSTTDSGKNSAMASFLWTIGKCE